MKALDLWHQGWYRHAHHIASPNFDERPEHLPISLLVLHSISLPPAEYGGDEVIRFFLNQLDTSAHPYFAQLVNVKVSAHFFIRRNGALIQFVSADKRAWHAGVSRFEDVEKCNDYSIGIEMEGIEGGSFEAAQYDSLSSLTQALLTQYPLQSAASHQHIAPDRKTDPGLGFDWLRFARASPELKIYA